MNLKRIVLVAVMALTAALVPIGKAAPTLDLTTAGASGTINGALFEQIDPSSTGTGIIQPFLRIGPDDDGIESGYNSDGGQFAQTHDNAGTNWNHSITGYRTFLLDINQTGGNGSLLSLDVLKIYLEPVGNLTGDPSAFPVSTPVYDLDAGGDNWILLDASLNSGSGSGDMLVTFDEGLFAGPNQYIYLYCTFGVNTSANDGFEEWNAIGSLTPVVPAPGAILLGGIGVSIVGWLRRGKQL